MATPADDRQFVERLAEAASDAVRQSRRAITADRALLQSVTIEVQFDKTGRVDAAESWISRRIPIARQLGLAERRS